MASSGAIKAGKAFVEIYADDSKLTRALNQQSRNLKKFGAGLAGIGAKMAGAGLAGVAAFGATSVAFAKAGDHLDKMAIRTGFSVQSLSQLGFAAEQSGTDIDSLENGLRGMARFSLNASRGLTTATDSLTDLGLSADDLKGKSPVDQFEMLAQKISEVEDPTKRAALSMSIFGKSGSKLLPLFAGGAEGIAALRKQADQLDLTMSPEDVKSAAALTDAMNVMKRSFQQIIVRVGGALAPAFTDLSLKIGETFAKVSKFIRENKGLTKSVFYGVTAVAGLGGAFIAVGGGIALAGVALGGFASLMGVLVSPIGLVVAGLAAGTVALLKFTSVGDTVKGFLGDLASRWKGTFGAITKSLKAGEMETAFKVLTAGLKVEWLTLTAFLTDKWIGFKNSFMNIWDAMGVVVGETLIDAFAGIEKAWISTQQFMLRNFGNSITEMAILIKKIQLDMQGKEMSSSMEKMMRIGLGVAVKVLPKALEGEKEKADKAASDQKKALNDEFQKRVDGRSEEKADRTDLNKSIAERDALNKLVTDAADPSPEEQNKKKNAFAGPEALAKKSGRDSAVNKIASVNTESELSSIANALTGEGQRDVTEEQKKTNSKMDRLIQENKKLKQQITSAFKSQVRIAEGPA